MFSCCIVEARTTKLYLGTLYRPNCGQREILWTDWVNRLFETFQTGLDRRESGAARLILPLCQYIIFHGVSGRVNSRGASDQCIPGPCHAGCGLHTAHVCRSLNRKSCPPPRLYTMPPCGSNDCRRPARTASLDHFADWAERLKRAAVLRNLLARE